MHNQNIYTILLLQSLIDTPLLVHKLKNFQSFDRKKFVQNPIDTGLNFDQKLGHLYEDALTSLLKNSKNLELIANNYQIFDKHKQTIGELDYIVFDKILEKYIHLELAVKFYLAIEKNSKWHYPGPDQRDNWSKKSDHMINHQLKLTERVETQEDLKNNFDIYKISTEHLIYGCFFFPISSHQIFLPSDINQRSRIGRWLYYPQYEEFLCNYKTVKHVPKYLWPVHFTPENKSILTTISIEDLKVLAQDRCAMFLVEGNDQPYFLVPDQWGQAL